MSAVFSIQIQEPCHENWAEMTSAERGRFCGSCQKVVTDFTAMSDSEIIAFFSNKRPTEDVCGRFYDRQLNKNYSFSFKNASFPYAKAAILISGLLFSNLLYAQKTSHDLRQNVKEVAVNHAARPLSKKGKMIEGIVFDAETGLPMKGVRISILNQKGIWTTGDHGKFKIDISDLKVNTVTLVAQKNESYTRRVVVDLNNANISAIQILLEGVDELKTTLGKIDKCETSDSPKLNIIKGKAKTKN